MFDDDESPDDREQFHKIFKGLIPWDIESFFAAHDFAAQLKTSPKDDWDHRRESVAWDLSAAPGVADVVRDAAGELAAVGLIGIDEDQAGVLRVTMNSLAFENQVARFIRKRHVDRYVATAHTVRFLEIGRFLRVHKKRLLKEVLIRKPAENVTDPILGQQEEIQEALLKALCELPYKGQRQQGPRGRSRPTPTFKLTDVLRRAKELLAEEEEDGGGKPA